jgi:hypothetical protein
VACGVGAVVCAEVDVCVSVWGAWAGGWSGCVEVVVEVRLWVPARAERLAELVLDLPGNALAAASVSTPVSTTLPARSQLLSLLSWRSAASRVWRVWILICDQCGKDD